MGWKDGCRYHDTNQGKEIMGWKTAQSRTKKREDTSKTSANGKRGSEPVDILNSHDGSSPGRDEAAHGMVVEVRIEEIL